MWNVPRNYVPGTDSHKKWPVWFSWSQAENVLCFLSSCAFCSIRWSTLSSQQVLLCTIFPFLQTFWVLPSPEQLWSGQVWHKEQSAIFNCHYGQQHRAKATIWDSRAWPAFSHPRWHTPPSVSVFSSLLPLTIISQFMLLQSSCTLKTFPKDLAMPCTVKGAVFF